MKNYMDLTGKTAIVTGASSGLGRRYAIALAEQGAAVAGFARRIERLNELKEEIEKNGGVFLPIQCDLSSEEQIIAGVDKVAKEFGKIDILINNAGDIALCPTTELSLAAWQKVVDVSLTSYFLMSREVGKHMIKNKYGRVINTCSMFGKIAAHHQPILAYNATKGAVPNFTRSLAQEWAEHNITVNAVGPGMFPSEMMVESEQTNQLLAARCPIGRMGRIEELLGQVLLFASDACSYTTGQTIFIDGGWTSV